jgi:hypothetical protein
MKEGITEGILFYAAGLGLTVLTYFTGPNEHGLGLYIIIFFLTLLVGLFWTGTTLYNYQFKNKTDRRKGILYSNTVVLLICIGTILFFIVSARLGLL